MGVDVYSENKTLQSELDRLAWADFSGGIGVSAFLAMKPLSRLTAAPNKKTIKKNF